MIALRSFGLAVVLAMLAATPVRASMFDFVTLAVGNEGFWSVKQPGGYTVDGITVEAGASNNSSGTIVSRAYLDAPSGGLPAGLGVCSLVSCAGSSDDNVGRTGDGGSYLETLNLDFSKTVLITEVVLRNRDHGLLANKSILINGVQQTTNALGAISMSLLLGVNQLIAFTPLAAPHRKDFYLATISVSAVPVPAALPLLASGVGTIVWAARRKRRQAA